MNENTSDAPALQPSLHVVSFMAGGYRFAVEAVCVRSQLPATEENTAIHAEKLLGLYESEAADSVTRRILLIKHPSAEYPILVSEPVAICDLSLDTLHPLPDLLAARCTLNGIRALSTGSEGITVLLDLGAINPDLISHHSYRENRRLPEQPPV